MGTATFCYENVYLPLKKYTSTIYMKVWCTVSKSSHFQLNTHPKIKQI